MGRHFGLAMLAGTLALGVAPPAVALSHISALHSGKLVIVLPSAPAFALPARSHVTVLPVLFGDANFYDRKPWVAAESRLQSPASVPFLKPYVGEIRALPLTAMFRTFGRKATTDVPWIGPDSTVGVHRYFPLTDVDTARAQGLAGHKDATAFIRPLLIFSSDFKRLHVIVAVTVYASGPVQAFFLDSKTLHAAAPIAQTHPGLKDRGLEGLAAGDSEATPAIEARARLWFANGAGRFKQALAAALAKLQKPLRAFLAGP